MHSSAYFAVRFREFSTTAPGYISEGSCAQAILALLTVIQRETGNGGCVFCCFVDIRKAFPRVRREILFHKMHEIGIPLICIKSIIALCTDIKGSARGPGGFSLTFPTAHGTEEGFYFEPASVFLWFFFRAVPDDPCGPFGSHWQTRW